MNLYRLLFPLSIVIIWLCSCVDLSQPAKDADKWIGKEIIIGRDTLIVMEYSAMADRLFLSDGSDVSHRFAKKYFDTHK